MTTHIPGQGEQMVLYYGFYSILSLKLRQKEIEAPCTKVQGIFYAR
jgi:hypothetical protein